MNKSGVFGPTGLAEHQLDLSLVLRTLQESDILPISTDPSDALRRGSASNELFQMNVIPDIMHAAEHREDGRSFPGGGAAAAVDSHIF